MNTGTKVELDSNKFKKMYKIKILYFKHFERDFKQK